MHCIQDKLNIRFILHFLKHSGRPCNSCFWTLRITAAVGREAVRTTVSTLVQRMLKGMKGKRIPPPRSSRWP
ncbi:hypothetical protein GN956_G16664 [Arapaima gigas]